MKRRRTHIVLIQRGHLPKRLEFCPRYACTVGEDGVTDCMALACPECGAGPVVIVPLEDKPGMAEMYCQVCTFRRDL